MLKEKVAKVDPAQTDEKTKAKNNSLMAKYFNDIKNPPVVGDVIEGKVISIEKAKVYVDLQPYGTGIIYGKEFITARDVIRKLNIEDVVSAKIIDHTNRDGYIELSLKEARQALIWDEAEQAIKDKTVFELPVQEANKGGLIIVWQGII